MQMVFERVAKMMMVISSLTSTMLTLQGVSVRKIATGFGMSYSVSGQSLFWATRLVSLHSCSCLCACFLASKVSLDGFFAFIRRLVFLDLSQLTLPSFFSLRVNGKTSAFTRFARVTQAVELASVPMKIGFWLDGLAFPAVFGFLNLRHGLLHESGLGLEWSVANHCHGPLTLYMGGV